MPEVLSVETEDDLNERAYRPPTRNYNTGGDGPKEPGEGGIPQWAIFGGLGFLILIALFIGINAFKSSSRGGDTNTTKADATKISTEPRKPRKTELSASDQRVESAQTALDDWGKFGSSMDLNALRGSFDTNGPQYKLLQEEAAAREVQGGSPYAFTITHPREIEGTQKRPKIRAIIEVSRNFRKPDLYYWDITLSARTDGKEGYWLYTVNQTPDEQRDVKKISFCDAAKDASQLYTDEELDARATNAISDGAKVGIVIEERQARADVWAALANSAPRAVSLDAQRVSDAQGYLLNKVSTASSYSELKKLVDEAAKTTTITVASDSFVRVRDVAQKDCGVEIRA